MTPKPSATPAEQRMSGAVDLDACPTRGRAAPIGKRGPPCWSCCCQPKCAVCGFGEHMAIHGPLYGAEPGSKPWGHEYVPGDT